jgi:hypothetical protein
MMIACILLAFPPGIVSEVQRRGPWRERLTHADSRTTRLNQCRKLKVKPVSKQNCRKILIVSLLVTFGTGCAARKPDRAINLPQFELHSSINTRDGVDKREARFVAEAYLARYVTLCGMPDDPVLEEDFWVTKLWIGYLGFSYAGRFRILGTTGDVVYEPRRNRLTGAQMERIKLDIALTERERRAANGHGELDIT